MAIIRVRQGKGPDQMLEASDHGIIDSLIHGIPQREQPCPRYLRVVPQHGAYPFLMDVRRPLRLKQASKSEPHQQMAERHRVKDASIQKNAGCPLHSGQTEFLIDRRHLVQNRFARLVLLVAISQHVVQARAPVGSDQARRDPALVQHFDGIGRRDVQ